MFQQKFDSLRVCFRRSLFQKEFVSERVCFRRSLFQKEFVFEGVCFRRSLFQKEFVPGVRSEFLRRFPFVSVPSAWNNFLLKLSSLNLKIFLNLPLKPILLINYRGSLVKGYCVLVV